MPSLDIDANDSEAEKKEKLDAYQSESISWLSNDTNAAAVNAALLATAGPTATLDGYAETYQGKYATYSGYVRDYDSNNNN